MANKKHKTWTINIVAFLALVLNTTHIEATTRDTMQLNILNKAQELIDTIDHKSKIIHHKIDSLKGEESISDSTFTKFLTIDVANYFKESSQQSNAIEILSATTELMEKRYNDGKILLSLYLPLGAAFEEVGLWSTAMDNYHKALTIAQANNYRGDLARIYNNIGVAYYKIDLDAAIEYFNKSLEINKVTGNKRELYLNYNNLAAIHVEQGKYDEALDYALMAIHMIDKEENADMYYFMQCNIGSLYIQAGNYNMAITNLENTRKYFSQHNRPNEQTTTNILLAEAYKEAGNMAKCNELITHIEKNLVDRINNADLEAEVRTTLANIFEERGEYKKAYHNLQIAAILKDSLRRANDELKVKNLEKLYENEQKLRENSMIINKLQLRKMQSDRQIIIVIIALLIISIVFIFFIIRTRMKDKLIKTNAMLAQQEKILQDKEMELQHIKEQELKRAIDQKNRELSSYALSYTKDNEFLANLTEELKTLLLEINPRDKEHKEHIRNIITQLKQHYSTDNWQEFKYYFEQVHPSFYDRLDSISPGMTQRQKRLCAMLYIGLSTKEISSITFREVRSIESARNRLRKKLDIPEEETIQDFLSRKLDQEK